MAAYVILDLDTAHMAIVRYYADIVRTWTHVGYGSLRPCYRYLLTYVLMKNER